MSNTVGRYYRLSGSACDEPFGREPFGRELRVERLRVERLRVERLRVETLRVERLGRVEFRKVVSLRSIFFK